MVINRTWDLSILSPACPHYMHRHIQVHFLFFSFPSSIHNNCFLDYLYCPALDVWWHTLIRNTLLRPNTIVLHHTPYFVLIGDKVCHTLVFIFRMSNDASHFFLLLKVTMVLKLWYPCRTRGYQKCNFGVSRYTGFTGEVVKFQDFPPIQFKFQPEVSTLKSGNTLTFH